MTFSILACDLKTGTLFAAAATGSLCVGGWVLRGDIESGLVASQGTAPSTFWRDDVIRRMAHGEDAPSAVGTVTAADTGRAHRQLTALDRSGNTGGFTGADSVPYAGHSCAPGIVVAGNMLAGVRVLDALRDAALATDEPDPAQRMLAALIAAHDAGSDTRGLQSAALLVLSPDAPPLDLRIDHDPDPLAALGRLLDRAQSSPYRDWMHEVPVLSDRNRTPFDITSDPVEAIRR